MEDNKQRHSIWLRESIWNEVKSLYRQDNCSTQNEFVENALRFYCGYLHAKGAENYLPRILSSTLEGHLNLFAERLGRLLYKFAVEEAIMSHLIAADTDIDTETLAKLRSRCVNDIKRTNGQISFAEILRFQKGL